ncbi:unnamed protein product [Ceutorhynchus assimilis]|uniref:Vitamin K-dependent gamma-carboxylase lumenal domain-containing protein n=1 Tax=Ceutorhynchus assimilis TaxID=467358 RepID=A0A9N9MSS9_9CUCU|nr:unnamed protein product [Ceutorhynchus assimilis]
MFPYVCLATLPLFCKEDWPRKVFSKQFCDKINKGEPKFKAPVKKVTLKQKFVVLLLLSHMGIQLFLPYSHFITKGFNNWTNGIYGYSWDMMVHSWETLVVVKIVDNNSGEQHFINNDLWTNNERWSKHADMCLQYAHCIENNLKGYFDNISVYIDIWSSLNKRFQQRMYDPNYDLLRARWSVFQPVEWLLPVLTKYNGFRKKLLEIGRYVRSWNNQSMFLDNYIDEDLSNVSLTVLEGAVVYEMENYLTMQSVGVKLLQGDSIDVPENHQHRVHTVSPTPSCYMYTFSKSPDLNEENVKMYSALPIFEDFFVRLEAMVTMFGLIKNATFSLLFGNTIYVRPRIQ